MTKLVALIQQTKDRYLALAGAEELKAVDGLVVLLRNIFMNAFPRLTSEQAGMIKDKNIMHGVIVPLVSGMKLKLDGIKYVEDNEGNWTKLYKDHLIYGGNINAVISDTGMSMLGQTLTLLGMLRCLTPVCIAQCIQHGYPFGFTTDFFKVEQMYSNEMIFTTPKALDMIVTPMPTQSTELAGGGITFNMSTKIQTVSNMSSGTGIRVPHAVPNVRYDCISTGEDKKPIIGLDYISTSRHENLESWLADGIPNDAVIKEALQESEAMRLRLVAAGSDKGMSDTYTAIIRPATQLNASAMPYMGIARHEATAGIHNSIFLENFHLSADTTNPYMSNLGALYNQRMSNSRNIITVVPMSYISTR